MSRRVLVTGAAGSVGSALVPGLPPLGWSLRLLDREPLPPVPTGTETVRGDALDPAVLDRACSGVDAIVHLAAIPHETAFAHIVESHVHGTYQLLEAARRARVRRVVLASSNHAVGFTPRAELIGVDVRPRPDGFYGVGKVATEALASLYVDRHGLRIACLRIGSFLERPTTRRHLSTWLSPGDLVRLVHACLTADDLRYAVVYGISTNTRGWWDLTPGRALGYQPQDDAEAYAAEILAATPEPAPGDPDEALLGGHFAAPAYDWSTAGEEDR